MKLIIQIPCLNEAEYLPATLAALPEHVEGFDTLEVMIIDDGSTDETVAVAKSLGVTEVICLNGHQGLARAFMTGLVACVERGADVIVNTDADNQYNGLDVLALVKPILEGKADIVVGVRPLTTMRHVSSLKWFLQVLGSRVVQTLSGAQVPDATSGFRALTRDAALRLNVFGDFTYTIETIIQAGLSRLRIESITVRVNDPTRPSRLFQSDWGYVYRSIRTILSIYVIYRPSRLFSLLSFGFLVSGSVLGVRYLVLMILGEGSGHVQSVVACAALILCGVFMAVIGVIAHLLGINRRLLEELRYFVRATQPRATSETRDVTPASRTLDCRPGEQMEIPSCRVGADGSGS